MLSFFKNNKETKVECLANQIIAPAKGKMIDVTTVGDKMFAEKMMGETVAFDFDGDEVTICAPATGTLSALFPTGHAFGITMENNTEIMLHIGVNTVSTKGDGFTILNKHQGDKVKAGEPIVKVDFKKLRKSYETSTMLIVINPAGHNVSFVARQSVELGSVIGQAD